MPDNTNKNMDSHTENAFEFKKFVDQAFEGIWILDQNIKIIYANQKICDIMGYSHEEIIGKPFSEFLFEEDIPSHRKNIADRRKGISAKYERRYKGKDGKLVWAMVSSSPVTDEKGNFAGIISMVLDITERKEEEKKLQETEYKYSEILEASHAGFLLIDANCKISFANQRIAKMLKIDHSKLIGSLYVSHIHPEQRKNSAQNLEKLINGELETVSYERKYICEDGSDFWGFLTAHRLKDTNNHFSAIVVVVSDITKEKNADLEISEYKNFLEIVLDTIPNQVFVRDFNGKYILVNKAFAEAMGAVPDEIIGKTNQELGDPEEIWKKAEKQDKDLRKKGKGLLNIEGEVKYPNGPTRWIQMNKRPLLDKNGVPRNILGVMTDLTERRKSELIISESEEKYRTLFEAMYQGVIYQLADGTITNVNPAACRIFGINKERFLASSGKIINWTIMDDQGNVLQEEEFPSIVALREGKPIIDKVLCVANKKRGFLTWVSVNATPQFHQGETKPWQVFVTLNDITAFKKVERELQNSENRYRTLVQNSPAAVYQTDGVGKNIYFNDRLCQITGLTREELATAGWVKSIHPDDQENVLSIWRKYIHNASDFSIEYRMIRPRTEEVVWVYDQTSCLQDENGNVIGHIGSLIDLTESKKAEEALKASEETNRVLLNAIPDSIFLMEPKGRILAANNKSLGEDIFSNPDVLHKNAYELISPKTLEHRKSQAMLAVRTKMPVQFEDEDNRKTFNHTIHPILNEAGEVSKLAILVRDITDQKRVETEIRRSEEKYKLLTENMRDVIWTMDIETRRFTYISPSVERLRGYSLEESMTQKVEEVIVGENAANVIQSLEDQVESYIKNDFKTDFVTNEIEQICKDGSTIWTEVITNCFVNPETGKIEIKGVTRDITERKRSEEEKQVLFDIMQSLALRQDLQQFFQNLHRSINKIIDARNISVEFYNEDTQLFEELYCVDEFDPPLPPSRLEKSLTSYVFHTKKPLLLRNQEFKELEKAGEVQIFGTNSAVWMGAPLTIGKRVIGVIGVQNYKDETCYTKKDLKYLTSISSQVAIAIERKRAEEALKASEEKHRFLIENSHSIIYTLDTQGTFTFISAAWTAHLGHATSSAIGHNINEFVHPDDVDRCMQKIEETSTLKTKQEGFEFRIRHMDGSWRWHITSGLPILDEFGNVTGFEGVSRDITDQKIAEDQLRESETRWQFAIEGAGDGLWDWYPQENKVYFSKQWKSMLGFEEGEIPNELEEWAKRVHPDDNDLVYKRLNPVLAGEFDYYSVEYRLQCKDGTYKWILDRGKTISHDSDHKPLRIIGTHADITERKFAEQALQVSEDRFRQIVESSNDVFYRQYMDSTEIEYISPNVKNVLGYSQEEIYHMTKGQLLELFASESQEHAVLFGKMLIQAVENGEKSITREFRLKKKEGEYIWVRGNYSLIRDEVNRPYLIVGNLSDITARKINEQIQEVRFHLMQIMPKVSLNELLVAALDEIEKIINSNVAFYHFIDEDQKKVSLQAWSTNTKNICGAKFFESQYSINNAGVWMDCVRKRKPIIHNDFPIVKNQKGMPEGHPSITRELTVPVIRAGKIVSILGVGNKATEYTSLDLELVNRLADITWDFVENKRIDEALNEQKLIFDAFMENSPIYVFFKDKEMRTIKLSRNYEGMLGKPLPELLGKNVNDMFPSELSKKIDQDDRNILNGGKTLVTDESMGDRHYTTIKFPIYKDEHPEYLAGFTIDITDRIISERKLAESEELYRLISTAVSDYLFSSSVDENDELDLIWVAGAFEKITGFQLPEYKAAGGWRGRLFPEDIAIDDDNFKTLKQNKKVETEVRIIKKDGTLRWVKVYAIPNLDEKGRLIRIDGGVQDITEKIEAEKEVNKRADEFSLLYETASDFSVLRETSDIIRTISDRARRIFNADNGFVFLYHPELEELELECELGGKLTLHSKIKPGEGVAGIVAQTQKPLIIEDYQSYAEKIPELNNPDVASVMEAPLTYGGQLIGVMGVHTDKPSKVKFTQDDAHLLLLFASQAAAAIYSADLFEKIRNNAIELEKRIDERTIELQLKNKELETFTYTVSHDLKAPLRGISGYSTLLMEDHADELDEEGKTYLQNLVNATERMNILIEDLLAYSRTERHEIKKTNIDLSEMIDKILVEHRVVLEQNKINLIKELSCVELFSDREALTQALRNLVDNAIKFSKEQEKPEIQIRSEIVGKNCRISIQDNGIGFDMKFHDKIFEIFQRLHLAEDYAGTGVGLALVRKAIERLGGKVWATSEIGKGSIFYMDIPL